jgi:glucuronokinase
MIEAARAAGASAKFTGSGGAIVGTYEGEEMFSNIKNSLELQGCEVFKPQIASDPANN